MSRTVPFIMSAVLYVCSIGIAISLPISKHAPSKLPPLISPTFASSPSSMTMFFSTDDDDDDNDSMAFGREADEFLVEPLLGHPTTSIYTDADV